HGRNGKDTLQKIITKTLGKALSGVVNMEMFLQSNMVKNSSGPSPDVLDLKGASIIWGNEAEENQRFSMSKMKLYNGNGAIKARGLQHADSPSSSRRTF
ncbi:MAG: DNA primase, partial [Mailhella sp.]|nr:DNA primase [Mailhella sp.]